MNRFRSMVQGTNRLLHGQVAAEAGAFISSGGSLTRFEALDVVIEVLREHPEFHLGEEFPDAQSEAATISGQANLILRRLIETRWLHEPQRPDLCSAPATTTAPMLGFPKRFLLEAAFGPLIKYPF